MPSNLGIIIKNVMHKYSFIVSELYGRFTIPSAFIFCSVDREGTGRNNLPALRCSFFIFKVYLATAIIHYCLIIDVRFYVSVVEEFSGIDADDMLG